MRHFMTPYLSLGNMIEYMFLFLCEGVSIQYRYIYALMKTHKDQIKTMTDGKNFLATFADWTKRMTNIDELKFYAVKFHVKKFQSYDFHKNEPEKHIVSVHKSNSKADPALKYQPTEML